MINDKLRNIAIIAHVDHGKTTLVDELLKQAGTFGDHEKVGERMMDSNDLERERGITILAKNTAIFFKGVKINIVDTPGHADFGGEVERVLTMVDGVLLLVDAAEGPLPQTRFVLKKAFANKLKVVVAINKIDRHDARPHEVLDLIFDLFVELGATNEQLDFKTFYVSAKEGFAIDELDHEHNGMQPLLDGIIKYFAPPVVEETGGLQMQITTLDYNDYVGRMGIGKIYRGEARVGAQITLIKQNGEQIKSRITKLYTFLGLKRVETTYVGAGDIAVLSGIEEINIGETICAPDQLEPLPLLVIDEPTISMTFCVNTSPFAGQEGTYVTSRHLKDRLEKESRSNVAIEIEPSPQENEYIVKGRGELQLSILIENMRREGYELGVSRPMVITKMVDGVVLEPFEHLVIDVPDAVSGSIINLANERQAEMLEMVRSETKQVHLEFIIPSRGMIGFHSESLTLTRGEGMVHSSFLEYRPAKSQMKYRQTGTIVSGFDGVSVAFALWNLQERGQLFIGPGVPVYDGMIIGSNAREGDMTVNPCKTKQLTNVRSVSADEAIRLIPHKQLTIEQALEFIQDDELVEITPLNVRIRKKLLTELERKRVRRVT